MSENVLKISQFGREGHVISLCRRTSGVSFKYGLRVRLDERDIASMIGA